MSEEQDKANSVTFVIERIRAEAEALGGGPTALTAAARTVKAAFPGCCLEAMETIGCYPSSEQELAALQRVWPER